MLFTWKMDGDDSAASLDKEARRMKPWTRRFIEWHYGQQRKELRVDADASWAAPTRHWRARALLAWLLNLVVLAVWLVVYTFFMMHMEGFERWDDPYWYASLACSGLPLLYALGRMRDRRKRLRPSPFFFWFDR